MTTAEVEKRAGRFSLQSFLPILIWLPTYQKGWLRADLIAALTVWALMVPQVMAYAGIAGLPPQAGLYAAPLALIAYAVFGTSRHLNVGPSSSVAALSFTVVSLLAMPGSEEFILLSIALALMVGLMLIIGGFLRLGVLADFLSRPVLDGFIVGVAISIAVGQLDKLLGFEAREIDFIPDILLIWQDIEMTHIPTLIVGTVSLILLFALNKYAPKLPGALIVLFLSIGLSSLLNFEAMGIDIVGYIPPGLPPFGIPEELSIDELMSVAPGALGVALVAFAESVAIARSFGAKFGYQVDANQELVALGAANLGSGYSGGFAVDGSMARTSVSAGSGAQTQMVSIVAAVAILITAVFLTPLFYNLPEATLGAIVIQAVWNNINLHKVTQYRNTTRTDFMTAIVALVGVLMFGLLKGLLWAAFLGLLSLLFRTKQRNTTVLGKEPNTAVFQSLENHPDGITYPGLLILRFDGSMFYANTPNFIAAARQAIEITDPPPQVILLDGESMNSVDATAVVALKEFQAELLQVGKEIRLARIKKAVLDVMQRSGLPDAIPNEHIYPSVQAGVDAYLAEIGSSPQDLDA